MQWLRISGGVVIGCVLVVPLAVIAQATSDDTFTVSTQFGENIDPPTVPENVTATPLSASQIDVAWDPSVDPFGVAGYQVFRDTLQVATTSQTQFSDTGLSASTTYTYTVRAFDGAGNISAPSDPVATTTFPTPPPIVADDPADDEPSTRVSGQAPRAELERLTIEVGSDVARFNFRTTVPVEYVVRYGQQDVLSDGIAQTSVLRREHTTVLTDLTPRTTYYYELIGTDQYGRTVVLDSGTFTTEPRIVLAAPSNVLSFSADVFGTDVLLRWQPPADDSYAFVRVVRNTRWFPTDPLDGTVVYQGTLIGYTDAGAMQGVDRQYYTIFVYNLSGVPSSGVVAIAARTPTVPSEPPAPPPVEEEEEVPIVDPSDDIDPPPPPVDISAADIEVVQADAIWTFADSAIVLDAEVRLAFRIAADRIPARARSVMMTVWRPDIDDRPLSFLLRPDAAGDYYEAVLPGLVVTGTYDVRFELYDGVQERFFTLTGLFAVDPPAEPPAATLATDQGFVTTLYMLLGGLLGGLLAVGLYWLLLWFVRRRESRR